MSESLDSDIGSDSLEEWPRELAWENVRAVPSYHWEPWFAQQVRLQVDAFQPDLIAVEIPDLFENAVHEAVACLPEMTAVWTGSRHLIPISPEDSIVEALRLGKERGIPTACIDLETVVGRDSEGVAGVRGLADPVLLEAMSLQKFIDLNSEIIRADTPTPACRKREQNMAYHLRLLSKKYQRILFICGMIHWERIRALLSSEKPLERLRHEGGHALGLVHVPPPMYFKITAGLGIPARALAWEHSRGGRPFTHLGWLSQVFLGAARELDRSMTPLDLKAFLQYSRHRGIVSTNFRRAGMIVDAAQSIMDEEFGDEVRRQLLTYPWHPDPGKFPFTVGYGMTECAPLI
ncbi:MAG TPA: hypothetical protein PKO06_19105, partial [Candidatus Ozemobacteraceae bacterium]|nr:hypothetical protein [Candidatus Ozemobacteraceae bacterium]